MNKKLIILITCIFIIMTGYGLILPVLPFYIERLALEEGVTQSDAFIHVGLLTGVFAFMQFLSAPLWGKLSDRIGRKSLLLFGLLGFSISMIFFGLGTNLFTLYTARIFGGLVSGATLPVAAAYVADVTNEDNRGTGMSWLGSAIGLGVVVGPVLGSYFSGFEWRISLSFGHFTFDQFSFPFMFSAALSLMITGVAFFWLPEIHDFHHSRNSSSYREKIKILVNPLFIPISLRPFLLIAFVYQFALATFEGNFSLHAKEILGFGPLQMGVIFSVCGLTMAVVQATLTGRFISNYGEKAVMPIGYILMALGIILLMPAQNLVFILISVVILALGVALIIPSLSSLVSKQFYKHVGISLGLLNSANSLGQASGAGLGGYLFTYQIHLPYLPAILLLIIAVVYLYSPNWRNSDRVIAHSSLLDEKYASD